MQVFGLVLPCSWTQKKNQDSAELTQLIKDQMYREESASKSADVSRGCLLGDFMDSFQRYISPGEFLAPKAEIQAPEKTEHVRPDDGVERAETQRGTTARSHPQFRAMRHLLSRDAFVLRR